ncbi:monocarboxylate transporter 12-like [Apostichopus japonicus]|uniref:monocarboxylate transporter 12-like n=1 Tax=Stichopus japonicus TaxID=307972 RepID=UPI003AB4FAC7
MHRRMEEWIKCRWGWVVCGASFFIHVGIYSLAYSFSLLFVDIQRDLNATAVETGWIGSVIWGVQMFSSPLGTFLESCFTHRPALILVIIVASAAIFVSSFAQSVQQLFVTLGAIYGLALGTSWFIMLCVIVQYYPAKNTVRAIFFATLGGTIAILVCSEPVNMSVEAFGWRRTLQFIGAFTLILSLPPAVLMFPPKDRVYESPRRDFEDNKEAISGSTSDIRIHQQKVCTSRETNLHQNDCGRRENEKSKVDRGDVVTTTKTTATRLEKWKKVICVDACLYSIFTVTCAMLWAVFFINIMSYYESVGITSHQGAMLLTITATFEMVTKVALVVIGERFPFKKTYLLLTKVIGMIGLSLAMVVATTFPQFVVLSCVTGILRAAFNVLLWPCSIETLGQSCSDEVITLTSISRGIGFLTGTIPAGAIYDKFGSYRVSFLIVATTSLVSALSLSMVLLRQKFVRRRSEVSTGPRQCNESKKSLYLRVSTETSV